MQCSIEDNEGLPSPLTLSLFFDTLYLNEHTLPDRKYVAESYFYQSCASNVSEIRGIGELFFTEGSQGLFQLEEDSTLSTYKYPSNSIAPPKHVFGYRTGSRTQECVGMYWKCTKMGVFGRG